MVYNWMSATGGLRDRVEAELAGSVPVVEGLTSSGATSSGVTVSWNQVPTAVKYRVYFSKSSTMPSTCEPNCQVIVPSDLAKPSYTLSGLTSNATYYVKASAINSAGKTITDWQTTPVTVKTKPGSLPSATAKALTRLQPARIVVLGGTGVVSAAVARQLAKFTTGEVSRHWGADRYATAAAVAGEFAPRVDTVFVAGGAAYADALAGAPLAGHGNDPVLLSKSVPVRKPPPTASSSTTASILQYYTTAWHTFNTAEWTGDAQFEAGVGPIAVVLPGGSTASYRGVVRSALPKTGSTDRNTVNIVSIDNYVRGAVAAEMPSSWKPEVLKAQAVAARSYGVRSLVASRYYDLCDTTSCQVYRGVDADTATTDAAVKATAGKILNYNGSPAFTQFSSSSGGFSALGSQPYLKAKVDGYDDWSGNSVHDWTKSVSASTLEKNTRQSARSSPSRSPSEQVAVIGAAGFRAWP